MTKEQLKWIKYYGLDGSKDEFEKLSLIPDHSEEAKKKMEELLAREDSDYSYHELQFLGCMDLQKLASKSEVAAWEFMAL